jgi:hypothetical protein
VLDLVEQLIARYREKGVLVDTSLLLLLFVGTFDSSLIPTFKRTGKYTFEHYQLLLLLLNPFVKVITTPNILTEVSNLSNQLAEPKRSLYFEIFAEQIPKMEELYIESRVASSSSVFVRFGITDAGILSLSQNQYLVLTADRPLAGYLASVGIDVINFNDLEHLALA